MKNRLKKSLLIIICIFLVFLLLYYSEEIFNGVYNGINVCLNSLIPSMYIFMILACFISVSNIDTYIGKLLNPISIRLFKMSGETFSIMLLSFIGGYPVGAKIISDKVKLNQLSEKDAQYLLNFCVYCSPAFIISGVSVFLWGNSKLGIYIYISQILSGILMAIVCAFRQKQVIYVKSNNNENSISNSLVYAVNNATKSMCVICSFVILFYALFALIDLIKLPKEYSSFIKGILEVTSGCQLIEQKSLINSVLLVSIFTSFGGFCVILQLNSILNNCNINLLKFIFIRVIFTAISTAITYIVIVYLQTNIQCFYTKNSYSFHMYTVSPISSIFLIALGLMLLLFCNKSDKIK